MRRLLLSLTTMLFAACVGEEQAETASFDDSLLQNPGHALASACSGCHAKNGQAISDLSNWSEEAIIASMVNYKNSADGTSVMHRLARGYTDQDIQKIAEFLAAEESSVQ